MIKHQIPIDKEIIISPDKVIMSKTDPKGIIQYINNYFIEICQYKEDELLGKAHNIIRHPDMPKIIFKIMWEKLHKGENLFAVVKNLSKDGSFYWVVTKFETTYDKNGTILAHYARRKAVPTKVRETAEEIYKKIIAIEKYDVELAEKTFYDVLESNGLTYDEFFLEIAEMTRQEVDDYFLSTKFNTNISNEDIIIEIDNENIEHIDLTHKENYIDKGFLGNISNELKKTLHLLQLEKQ